MLGVTFQMFLLSHTSTFLSLVVAVLALVKFQQRTPVIRLLGVAYLLSFLSNIIGFSFYLAKMGKLVNIPPSIYIIIKFCIVSMLYYHAIGKRKKTMFLTLSILVTIFSGTNLLVLQREQINTYSNVTVSIIIMLYAIYYFYWLMVNLPATHVLRHPMFWINSGLLIFHGGAFFIFLFTHYLVNVLGNNLLLYWSFHNILSIVMYIIMIIGLWTDLRSIKLHTS